MFSVHLTRFVSVDPGNEVVLSYDGTPLKMWRTQISVNRIQCLEIYEKLLGADTLEMGHVDYSFKPIKPIVGFEQPLLEKALSTHIPHPFSMEQCPTLACTVSQMDLFQIHRNFCQWEK